MNKESCDGVSALCLQNTAWEMQTRELSLKVSQCFPEGQPS
jgi:hypothetical protein